MGLPILCAMEPPVTLPLAGSTVTTQTPLPVMCRERASYGYWGRGAFTARAFALDIVIAWALIGVNFCCAVGGGRGGGVVSSTRAGLISAGGGSQAYWQRLGEPCPDRRAETLSLRVTIDAPSSSAPATPVR